MNDNDEDEDILWDNDDDDDENMGDVDINEDILWGGEEEEEEDDDDGKVEKDVNIRVAINGKKIKKKKRKIEYILSDILEANKRRSDDLMGSFYKIQMLSKLCNNELLQCTILSILPLNLHKINNSSKEYLEELMDFFENAFEHINDKYDDDVNDVDDLLHVIQTRSGSIHQILLLFLSLLRSLNIPSRYVRTIDPIGGKPSDHLDFVERVYREANQDKPFEKKRRKIINIDDDLVKSDNNSNDYNIDDDNDIDNSTYKYKKKCTALAKIPFSAWIEVNISTDNDKSSTKVNNNNNNNSSSSSSSNNNNNSNNKKSPEIIDLVDDDDDDDNINAKNTKTNSNTVSNKNVIARWVHLDLVRKDIDKSMNVEASRPNKRAISYVFGCDNNHRVKDVTRRYAQQYNVSMKSRDPRDIFVINNAIAKTIPLNLSIDEILRNDNEDIELMEQITVNTTAPTTVNGFKNHHLYVLNKDIKSSQILRPKAKICGMIKGQPYYNRSDVFDLNSRNTWSKAMREVIDGEVPVKIETRNVKGKQIKLELYAQWQTKEMIIPSVGLDGTIPVNKYGNVEVWKYDKAFVPKGAVLLTNEEAPAALKVAQELGLPHAKAVVDFEKGYPKYGGVVVLAEHSQLIRDSSANIVVHKEEVSKKKSELKIIERWQHLVSMMIRRNDLRNKYGF